MSGSILLKSTMLRSGMIVGASVVALTLGACASSGNNNNNGSRYGSVYDYESGSGSCGGSCGAVVTPPVTSRYGSANTVIGGQPVSPGVVYADCSQVSGMNCGAPAPVYTAPAASYGAPVNCPTGTTAAGDGTCMMSGGGSYTGSSTTYTGSSSSYGEAVNCPSGTSKASDGTCMMSDSGSTYTGYSGSSSSTYSSSSSASGGTVDCPSGTTKANDGTCMMSSGSSNVTIYPTTGYVPPVDYTAPVYQPIRK